MFVGPDRPVHVPDLWLTGGGRDKKMWQCDWNTATTSDKSLLLTLLMVTQIHQVLH